jgi:hypothetical protein
MTNAFQPIHEKRTKKYEDFTDRAIIHHDPEEKGLRSVITTTLHKKC